MLGYLRSFFRPRDVSHMNSWDIYPTHRFDDHAAIHDSSPCWLMRFNDVLDANKLHASLSTVLIQGDWKKLGGRLRRDTVGKLNVHVPQRFTVQHPAVCYTNQVFDVSINEHALGKHLPKPTDQPSLQQSTNYFGTFSGRTNSPGWLVDYLNSEDSQLSLHITSFTDATLVALSWPHTMTDAMGRHALISAWCKALAGREKEILPLLGARQDTISHILEAEDDAREPYMWESKALTGLKFLRFALGFLWQILWQRQVGTRTLFFPASSVAKLRRQAQNDVPEGYFLSDGDVLSAWITRMVVACQKWTHSVTLLNVVDMRSRLPSIYERGGAYVQNLTIPSFTFLNGPDVVSNPLGILASEVRQSIVQQATAPQIKAFIRASAHSLKVNGRQPMYSEPEALLVTISNWSKAKFIDLVDFSPAVIRLGEQGAHRRNPPGRMEYQLTSVVKQAKYLRNSAVILGKDHNGNYWVNLYMAEAMFDEIENYLISSAI
jgi:hypothetical protein